MPRAAPSTHGTNRTVTLTVLDGYELPGPFAGASKETTCVALSLAAQAIELLHRKTADTEIQVLQAALLSAENTTKVATHSVLDRMRHESSGDLAEARKEVAELQKRVIEMDALYESRRKHAATEAVESVERELARVQGELLRVQHESEKQVMLASAKERAEADLELKAEQQRFFELRAKFGELECSLDAYKQVTCLELEAKHTAELSKLRSELEVFKQTAQLEQAVEVQKRLGELQRENVQRLAEVESRHECQRQAESEAQLALKVEHKLRVAEVQEEKRLYMESAAVSAQSKAELELQKAKLAERVQDLEDKCKISSRKGQHGEYIVKELIEELGLVATATAHEKDAGDIRVTEDEEESGFYTNDDNMRLKIECKKKGRITKGDLRDFEESATRAFQQKQANQALFISLDYWIPGHSSSVLIKYVDDEFGRPILPMVFIGASRRPFQPVCREQIELLLNMHLQMHQQLTKFKNNAMGTELQDEHVVQVRGAFERTAHAVEEMNQLYAEQDANIQKLQLTQNKMRTTTLLHYKRMQTINAHVPWLSQPMTIRHENLLDAVFAKGVAFDWNTTLNGTQRQALKKHFGEESVKEAHRDFCKRQKLIADDDPTTHATTDA